MKKIFLSLICNGFSLYLADKLVDNMRIQTTAALILAAIIFGILNVTIKPILKLFALPVTILTLGLFLLVINAAVLQLTDLLVPHFVITGFMPAIWAALLISIFNGILHSILNEE